MSNVAPLRVLSLDGGGMRGTYTATYLGELATNFARKRGLETLDVGAAFDLIVGTSTGAIIASALAVGVPMSDVVALYRADGAKIFKRKLPRLGQVIVDCIRRPTALRQGTEALRRALTDRLGDATIHSVYRDRGIALAVPAVEMSQHRAWVFKSPHVPGSNHRDDGYSLVDVCMATSAAPIFRSMAALDHPGTGDGDYNVFVDGGLWANNPVLVALIDALDIAKPDQEIHIFCLGTCPVPAGEQIARDKLDRGLPRWKFGGEAASLSIDAQQFAFDHMARKLSAHVNRTVKIVRFPSDKVPAALIPYLGLDETRDEAFTALINQARTDADMTNSRCMSTERRDAEAQIICDLFDSMPPLTAPLFNRNSIASTSKGETNA